MPFEKLGAAQARLVAAEAIEKRNADDQEKRNNDSIILENRLAALADENRRLSEQKTRLEGLIEEHKNLVIENDAAKKEIQKQRGLYDGEISKLESVRKENERILSEAEALKASAEGKLIAADEKVKAGQLSVDRQWNEIEIQKKKLELERLKIEKLAKDNGIEAELKALRGKV